MPSTKRLAVAGGSAVRASSGAGAATTAARPNATARREIVIRIITKNPLVGVLLGSAKAAARFIRADIKKVASGRAGRTSRPPIACGKAAHIDAAHWEGAMIDRFTRWFAECETGRLGAAILAAAALVLAGAGGVRAEDAKSADAKNGDVPRFQVDPFWPKPLPGDWILGQVAGVAVDKNDHIWIIHRPSTLVDDEKEAMKTPPTSRCCHPAPPVLEFDPEGNLLRHWGGPGQGYDWPKQEHGIFVDNDGNVWLAGNDNADNQILKFT